MSNALFTMPCIDAYLTILRSNAPFLHPSHYLKNYLYEGDSKLLLQQVIEVLKGAVG